VSELLFHVGADSRCCKSSDANVGRRSWTRILRSPTFSSIRVNTWCTSDRSPSSSRDNGLRLAATSAASESGRPRPRPGSVRGDDSTRSDR
jgi:hypothetical protein